MLNCENCLGVLKAKGADAYGAPSLGYKDGGLSMIRVT